MIDNIPFDEELELRRILGEEPEPEPVKTPRRKKNQPEEFPPTNMNKLRFMAGGHIFMGRLWKADPTVTPEEIRAFVNAENPRDPNFWLKVEARAVLFLRRKFGVRAALRKGAGG